MPSMQDSNGEANLAITVKSINFLGKPIDCYFGLSVGVCFVVLCSFVSISCSKFSYFKLFFCSSMIMCCCSSYLFIFSSSC
jgi:hypothetical protein